MVTAASRAITRWDCVAGLGRVPSRAWLLEVCGRDADEHGDTETADRMFRELYEMAKKREGAQ